MAAVHGRDASVLKVRREAAALLALALLAGAGLRFYRLGRMDLSADEGASWAAAAAPDLRAVIEAEQRLDPGKLAFYDILLHGWIGVFGDSRFAMRAMSAGLGTLAIVLVFASVREVVGSLAQDSTGAPAQVGWPVAESQTAVRPAGRAAELSMTAGAFAALQYAANVAMVQTDRTVRMYPLVISAELLQITFLVRAQRRGGLGNYLGVAICTAAMIAANFTAGFLLAAEGLWLACLLVGKWAGARTGGLAIFRPAAALAAGLLLLAPMMPGAIASSAAAVRGGAIDWLKLQPVWWPYTTLRWAAGSHSLFWFMVGLGVGGVCWNWRTERLAAGFLGAWLLGPFVALMAVTYLIRPMEFPRYVIIGFVALFALAGLGAGSPRSSVVRIAIAAFLVVLSLRPFHRWARRSREAAWGAAAALAERQAAPGVPIAVFPAFADNVVRYYLPAARRRDVIGVQEGCGLAQVLILSGRPLYPPQRIASLETCYPHKLASLPKVEVRTR